MHLFHYCKLTVNCALGYFTFSVMDVKWTLAGLSELV